MKVTSTSMEDLDLKKITSLDSLNLRGINATGRTFSEDPMTISRSAYTTTKKKKMLVSNNS